MDETEDLLDKPRETDESRSFGSFLVIGSRTSGTSGTSSDGWRQKEADPSPFIRDSIYKDMSCTSRRTAGSQDPGGLWHGYFCERRSDI